MTVLDGTLDVSLHGDLSSATGAARIPATLAVRLASEHQKIEAESEGALTFTARSGGMRDAKLDLTIADGRITGPVSVTDVPVELFRRKGTVSRLALTALFVLASAPLQKAAYNPQTKTFSMRIRLTDKTSMIAGTGGGKQEVGDRQRIGKGWSITTTCGTTTDPTVLGGATAPIEWTKRC